MRLTSRRPSHVIGTRFRVNDRGRAHHPTRAHACTPRDPIPRSAVIAVVTVADTSLGSLRHRTCNYPTGENEENENTDTRVAMKLYYAPGACSLAPHIALREAGMRFDLVRVDFMRGKSLPDGSPYTRINPKGYVPALEIDGGRVFTETAVVVQYIADLRPEVGLAPRNGTFERLRLQEWLVFIATELHKALAPFFSPEASDEYKATIKDKLDLRFGFLNAHLEGSRFLLGDDFSVAEGYALYAIRTWEKMVRVDLAQWPALGAYRRRIEDRPAVRAALDAEGMK